MELNYLNLVIDLAGQKLYALLYSNDITLLAVNENDFQCILDVLHDWCKCWRVLINTEKSKCIHFRKPRCKPPEFEFKMSRNKMVDEYKYLPVVFLYNGVFSTNAEALSKAADRALGKIILNIHRLKDFGIKSYEKLFYSCEAPILDYSLGKWGCRKFQTLENIKNRAIRYFLEYTDMHRYSPSMETLGGFRVTIVIELMWFVYGID